AALRGLIRPTTRLASVMLANHETGVLQPIAELAAICQAAGVPLHTDAAQVAGKLPIDFQGLGVTAMTISAHKFGGPPGIGALLLRAGQKIRPLLHGGFQQSGLRPGTEPLALVLGMRAALAAWCAEQGERAQRLQAMRDRFETELSTALPDLVIAGRSAPR